MRKHESGCVSALAIIVPADVGSIPLGLLARTLNPGGLGHLRRCLVHTRNNLRLCRGVFVIRILLLLALQANDGVIDGI